MSTKPLTPQELSYFFNHRQLKPNDILNLALSLARYTPD